MIMNKNVGTSCIIVYSCVGEYPYFMMVQTHTLRDRKTIIIMLRRSRFLNGCPHQQLPENARPTRKGPRRCTNQLVGPYSHVWAVCGTINTHPNNPFRIAAQGI